MLKIFIPPNGFAGHAQQTIATKALVSKPKRRPRTAKRKRVTTSRIGGPVKRRKRPVTRKKRVVRRAAKPARMVKGSVAAKRHMAKLRKMRKR